MNSEIVQLSISFDPELLQHEVAQFVDTDWLSHPMEAAGNASLPLVSVGGTKNIDYAISGLMDQTTYLAHCPYIQQVLQAFDTPLSRCRLVRQVIRADAQKEGEPQAEDGSENLLSETNYHWFRRRAIYIPILTVPRLTFAYGQTHIHMAPGEAWAFDPKVQHGFSYASENQNLTADRVSLHLVIETKEPVTFSELNSSQILLEPYTFEVLTPQELSQLLALMLAEIKESQIEPAEFVQQAKRIEQFELQWQQTFERFGYHPAGELAYQDLLVDFQEQIVRKVSKWVGSEGKSAMAVIRSLLQTAPAPKRTLRKQVGLRIQRQRQKKNAQRLAQQNRFNIPAFDRPLFIVSAPRAGSTLLFETLQHFPELWSTGEENHELVEEIPELHPAASNYASNRLMAADVQPETATQLHERFGLRLQDRTGELFVEYPEAQQPTAVRFLEKTPKNALRIPFIKALFPDAQFLFLYREPAANISSMLEGWRTQRFIAYRPLPGWPYRNWSFLLVPGWQSLTERPIAEIAAYQWQMANQLILDDLATLPDSDWHLVRYDDLVQRPRQTFQQIATFAQLGWDELITQRLSQSLPTSSMTLSAPDRQKWRKNGWQIEPLLPKLEAITKRVEALASFPTL